MSRIKLTFKKSKNKAVVYSTGNKVLLQIKMSHTHFLRFFSILVYNKILFPECIYIYTYTCIYR